MAVRSLVRPCALVLCLAAAALADVVKLRNGAELKGEVLSEDEAEVVIRTSGGKVKLPRKEVAEVVRESAGRTLVERARQALAQGKRDKARALLERAAQEQDERARRDAQRLLEELAQAPEPAAAPGPARPADRAADPFELPEEEALFRELEREAATSEAARKELYARLVRRAQQRAERKELKGAVSDARRARALAEQLDLAPKQLGGLRDFEHTARLVLARRSLRQRDSALALAAAEPVATTKDLPSSYASAARYLYGRALEASNRAREGEASYRRAIDRDLGSNGHLAAYRELARLASLGVPIDQHSPGVGPGWRWVQTPHFSILHQLPPDATLGARFEEFHRVVSQRLGIAGKLDERDPIPVFIYADEASYRQSAGARFWSAGHARRLSSSFDDEDVARAVYFYPSPRFDDIARHELAHVLVWDALDDALIPAWATEGAALYAEGDRARAQRLKTAYRYRSQLAPCKDHLERMRLPATQDTGEIMLFYVQSGVSFEVLADGLGVERAFRVAQDINKEGPEVALRGVGWSLANFEGQVTRALEAAK